MIFVQKSYGTYTKVEKPGIFPTSYEGLDDEEDFETLPIIINNLNEVSNSKSDSNKEDFENNKENIFGDAIHDQLRFPTKPLST